MAKTKSSKKGKIRKTKTAAKASSASGGKLVRKAVRPKSTGPAAAVVDPTLSAYLREIQRYPLLTREEERDLAVRVRESGDREALQKLVTSNLRFVVKIAYEYVHYRVKILDLIQEGNMGLLKAVHEFDPYKDVRLTTYAVWWIRSYIQDAILKNYSLVKIGTTQAQKKLFYRLRSEQKKLEQMGLVPQQNVKLLANRLEVREQDIEEMDQRLSGQDFSLNAPQRPEGGQEHLQDLAHPQEAADVALGEVEQRHLFQKLLEEFAKTLEGREKVIFENRLVSEEPLTLQEIGDKYGVTKERARQLEELVKQKLKAFVQSKYPDYHLLAPPQAQADTE